MRSHAFLTPPRSKQTVGWPLAMVLCFISICQGPAVAQSTKFPWPQRHGPLGNGHVPAELTKDFPTTWNEAEGEHIAWKVDVPLFGHSTPIVGSDKLWLTTATQDGRQQFLLCYDTTQGELVYEKLLFKNESPEPLGNEVNTYASPTPALEPGALYVHFGSYGTARVKPDSGEVVWARRDIECRHFRGPGSSPILFQSLLILTFDGIDQQFLMALDKETGQTVWRVDRSTDYGDLDENGQPKADGDYRKAYSTPGLKKVGDRWQVISVGSRAAFGYDALTGEEIWTLRHDDYNAAAPPVFYKDLVILNTGSRQANLTAVQLDETTRGDITESHVVWDIPRGNSRLAAPLLANDRIYMINDSGVIRCVAAASGEILWQDRVSGNFVASPIIAKGLIYFCNEEGTTYVVRDAAEFELVAENRLADGMRASPAAGPGALYLRTFGELYRLGE